MKELCSLARNLHLVVADSGLVPQAEMILVVSEPSYRLEGTAVVKTRAAETFRVSVCRESLKNLIEYLNGVDDELRQLEEVLPVRSPGDKSQDTRQPGGQTP